MKILFQDLCVSKFGWDDSITREFIDRWNEILSSLNMTHLFSIDRQYAYKNDQDPFESIELHGFSDASQNAYDCCVYLRFKYRSGTVKVTFAPNLAKKLNSSFY